MVYWWGKGEEQIQGECTEGEGEAGRRRVGEQCGYTV